MIKRIHVAAGVIVNAQQEVLLALRPQNKHQGGLWEFPGGKVEATETVSAALHRELLEEIAVTISKPQQLLVIEHDYVDKQVVLDVWLVREWSGKPQGLEQQEIRWVKITELNQYQFPAANLPIVEFIQQHLAVVQNEISNGNSR